MEENSLVPQQQTHLMPLNNPGGVPSQHELMAYQAYAKTAVDSQMYRGIGKEAGVMMIILAAREYGIGPCQALNGGVRIIEGNVELSARMMSALIRRSKHNLKVLENTDTKCTVYGKRRDTGDELTLTYTIEMAQRAGLVREKGTWKKNPEDMLFARAMSRLARQLFSDVVGIGYVEGEIDDSRASNEVLEPSIETVSNEIEIQNESILNHIDPNEHDLFNNFIEEVGQHYKWSRETTLKNFMQDKNKTLHKFHAWKDKNNKGK